MSFFSTFKTAIATTLGYVFAAIIAVITIVAVLFAALYVVGLTLK